MTQTASILSKGSKTGLRFAPDIERRFQADYYARVRPTLRIITLILALLFLAYARRDFNDTHSLLLACTENGAPAAFFLVLCVLTYTRGFEFGWQIAILFGGLCAGLLGLGGMAWFLSTTRPTDIPTVGGTSADALFFRQQLLIIMICTGILRAQFRWASMLQSGLALFGTCVYFSYLNERPLTPKLISEFLQPVVAVGGAVLLAAWFEERLSRANFLSNLRLSELEAEERRKRVASEEMLSVLGQSIGGIVHDLGGPLTSVQMGAQTLELFLEVEADKDTLREFTGAITNGAQMLNYLRLSLIEQTRVLEGKPTPVKPKPAWVQPILEAGKRFQKSYLSGSRDVIIEGEDAQIHADEMKLVTVFMNLIGNALKYSDGNVRVVWRETPRLTKNGNPTPERMLMLAVCDQGTQGRGITREDATKLFAPFARLETHKGVEGTGLGLISVAHILAAHGGEAFIQGYTNGLPTSAPFTTGANGYPFAPADSYRTAFVVLVQLETKPDPDLPHQLGV